jgi:hypothetical protein
MGNASRDPATSPAALAAYTPTGNRPAGSECRVFRLLIFVIGILLSGLLAPGSALSARPAVSQPADTQAAADFARLLSRLEEQRDWWTLASLMHPDSAAIVPEPVVSGWYEDEFADKETAEISVTGVIPEPWTWAVTGRTYQDAVTVTYVQTYWIAGVRADLPGEVHVVHDGERWGWFFAGSRVFLDQQIARYAPGYTPDGIGGLIDQAMLTDAERLARFPDPLHAAIDAFWAQQFVDSGRDYRSPDGVVEFSSPIETGCGSADPASETAFYCVLDQTIYYATGFRDIVQRNIGDFGWAVVIAHEWAHHAQKQLGYDFGLRSYLPSDQPEKAWEQQADCLAGAYTDAAEFNGWLEPGDLDEALRMTALSGDHTGAATPHGSGEERTAAFLRGYEAGVPACNLGL